MDVLKKIKASTLVETIIASVLIVLIFGISSIILNNVFKSTIKNDPTRINYQLNKLIYQYKNKGIQLPYQEEFLDFEVFVEKEDEKIFFFAKDIQTKKNRALKIILND